MLDWTKYIQVADRFQYKAKRDDREDLRQDIILKLAQVECNNGHKPFSEAVMYRIASRTVTDYWYRQYRITNGLDCGHCSKAQKVKCKGEYLYSECPKAIKLESLNQPVIDEDGNTTELGELIADDKASDLAEWTSPDFFLYGYPQRLIVIAQKIQRGEALTPYERLCLCRFRKQHQKSLLS